MTISLSEDETPMPKVTDAPDTIWLVYGELEGDVTHAKCHSASAVHWCEDQQFSTDVRYVRADLVEGNTERGLTVMQARGEVIEPIGAQADSAEVEMQLSLAPPPSYFDADAAIAEAVAAERERCAAWLVEVGASLLAARLLSE